MVVVGSCFESLEMSKEDVGVSFDSPRLEVLEESASEVLCDGWQLRLPRDLSCSSRSLLSPSSCLQTMVTVKGESSVSKDTGVRQEQVPCNFDAYCRVCIKCPPPPLHAKVLAHGTTTKVPPITKVLSSIRISNYSKIFCVRFCIPIPLMQCSGNTIWGLSHHLYPLSP